MYIIHLGLYTIHTLLGIYLHLQKLRVGKFDCYNSVTAVKQTDSYDAMTLILAKIIQFNIRLICQLTTKHILQSFK